MVWHLYVSCSGYEHTLPDVTHDIFFPNVLIFCDMDLDEDLHAMVWLVGIYTPSGYCSNSSIPTVRDQRGAWAGPRGLLGSPWFWLHRHMLNLRMVWLSYFLCNFLHKGSFWWLHLFLSYYHYNCIQLVMFLCLGCY